MNAIGGIKSERVQHRNHNHKRTTSVFETDLSRRAFNVAGADYCWLAKRQQLPLEKVTATIAAVYLQFKRQGAPAIGTRI